MHSESENILEHISKNAIFLNDSEIAQGIVFPQDSLNKKGNETLGFGKIGDGIFVLSNKELYQLALNENEKDLIKPYFTTEQIKRYYTNRENNHWAIYTDSSFKDKKSLDSYPHIKAHLDKYKTIITSSNKPYGLHRARNPYFFTGEKILCLRKCPIQPVFSYADFDTYVSQTFFIIKTKQYPMKFLVGLLNSKLIKFWLYHRGKMQGNNFQLDKEPLLNIPLPTIGVGQNEITCLVDQILAKKEISLNTDQEECDIDNIVYKIYGLSIDEISIVEKI